MVSILGMSYGLTGRSDKVSARRMIHGILTVALGHGRLNSIADTNKYDQLLIPKWNLSQHITLKR